VERACGYLRSSAVSADRRCSHDHERTKDARTGDEVPNDGHTDCPP
jgi:hypothetical protein